MKQLLVFVLIGLAACTPKLEGEKFVGRPESMEPQQIYRVSEKVFVDKLIVYAIRIDGHLYLMFGRGGILHAESCSCKMFPFRPMPRIEIDQQETKP